MAPFKPQPRWSATITADPIEVTTDLPTIDPAWEFIDAAGHKHSGAKWYATTREIMEPCDCGLVVEPHETHVAWVCDLCGEELRPGVIAGGTRRFIQGMISCTVDVELGDRTLTYSTHGSLVGTMTDKTPEEVAAILDADPRSHLISVGTRFHVTP